MEKIIFKIFDSDISLEKPSWWDILDEKLKLNLYSDIDQSLIMDLVSNAEWKNKNSISTHMISFYASYFKEYGIKNIPNRLIQVAEELGRFDWIITIFEKILSIIEKNNQSEISITRIYGELGSAYFGVNDLQKAIHYYKLNKESLPKDYYSTYFDSNYNKLVSIKDLNAYQDERNSFVELLFQCENDLKKLSNLDNIQNNLLDTVKDINFDELSIFQLAFLKILDEDATSGNSKIWSTQSTEAFYEEVKTFYNREIPNLDMIPLNIDFPTKKKYNWTMYLEGIGEEIVYLEYDRWELKKTGLIH